MSLCGGTGATMPATPEVQELCDQLKPEVEEKSGKKYNEFTAVNYKSQVVAGTNYFINVKVAEEEFVHLRVHKPLPHAGKKPSLANYQTSKTKHDEIGYF